MADLQPQRPMDCFTSRPACSSTCPSVVARMPGRTSTHPASAFSTFSEPDACAVAAHAMAASTAAGRGKLFDKRASVGGAADHIPDPDDHRGLALAERLEIGRASCRERVLQSWCISVGADPFNKKTKQKKKN